MPIGGQKKLDVIDQIRGTLHSAAVKPQTDATRRGKSMADAMKHEYNSTNQKSSEVAKAKRRVIHNLYEGTGNRSPYGKEFRQPKTTKRTPVAAVKKASSKRKPAAIVKEASTRKKR
jgi:hypothetical protein